MTKNEIHKKMYTKDIVTLKSNFNFQFPEERMNTKFTQNCPCLQLSVNLFHCGNVATVCVRFLKSILLLFLS